MRFKEAACGNCGLDLTEVEPTRLTERPQAETIVIVAPCPQCGDNRIVLVGDLSVLELMRLLGLVPNPATQVIVPPIHSILPTPTAENEGMMVRHQENTESKTELYICVCNSAGGYEWIEIGEST